MQHFKHYWFVLFKRHQLKFSKDIAFFIPSKMGTVVAGYKNKQVISGKLAQGIPLRQSDCRSQHTLVKISPHLCWFMCNMDNLTWWFQVKLVVHKTTNFSILHAKLLTQVGETKTLCAGSPRTTLVGFKVLVIWSNLFLLNGWVRWSRGGLIIRRERS